MRGALTPASAALVDRIQTDAVKWLIRTQGVAQTSTLKEVFLADIDRELRRGSFTPAEVEDAFREAAWRKSGQQASRNTRSLFASMRSGQFPLPLAEFLDLPVIVNAERRTLMGFVLRPDIEAMVENRAGNAKSVAVALNVDRLDGSKISAALDAYGDMERAILSGSLFTVLPSLPATGTGVL